MKTEIEVKFIDVDIDDIRRRLEKVGAVLEQPMRLMKRALVETPDMAKNDAFVRLRDEGDKVTLTYKQFQETSLTGAREHEVMVSDFDTTKAIIELCGLAFHTYQESKRETWKLGNVEVVIDQWPWMPPYIEIEGESEKVVRDAAKLLGFSWDEAVFGGADKIYELLYEFDNVRGVIDIPEVRFDSPLPKEFKKR